ncbi:MAG: hypothetical protein NWE89_07050 [Candidatus Bathyarchaeota archaeon]|nr:hypothetical protein [Candidatus Bathyarchaeota archaeon]
MPLQLDTGKKGLEMFFKGYQIESLRYLWQVQPEGANSKAVWTNVNESLQGSISRASIINYLNHMVYEELLTYTKATGKGGHHRVYYMKYSETEFKQQLVALVIKKLLTEYPEETRKVIQLV